MTIDRNRIAELLERFSGKQILIIGDVILDKYIHGQVRRISPEAPIPVVEIEREEYVPGGAANVAANVNALGGRAVLLGVSGVHADALHDRLNAAGIDTFALIQDSGRRTTEKIRVISQQQQLLRIDYEDPDPLAIHIREAVKKQADCIMENGCAAVIISDYNKGVISKDIAQHVITRAGQLGVPIGVDPKPGNGAFYLGASFITPNHFEAAQMAGMEERCHNDLFDIGRRLMTELSTNVILTRGKDGMIVFEQKKEPVSIPTKAIDVYDVTGAGDTVIAAIMLAMCAGAGYLEASQVATYAASVTVSKFGAGTVTRSELFHHIKTLEEDQKV